MSIPFSSQRDFNQKVLKSIDDLLSELLGRRNLETLYAHLKDHYDIGPDEIPYRLSVLYQVLETKFDVIGAKTIGDDVARKLYGRLNLTFVQTPNYALEDYIEQAKKTLSGRR